MSRLNSTPKNKVLENRRKVQSNMIEEGNNAFDMQEDAMVKKSALFERNEKGTV